MKKALLVGINQYPDPRNNLNGCINDINDMSDYLIKEKKFDKANIKLIKDEHATKANIMEGLAWLVKGAAAGDQIFFQYSGHGAQMPTQSKKGEADKLDEVICPYDFAWTDETALKDKEFNQVFAQMPKGVEFIWVSDSCHSQDLSREFKMPIPGIFKARSMTPPLDIAERVMRIKASPKAVVQDLPKLAKLLNLALISGCKSNQESADAVFNQRANGALTYFLLQSLTDKKDKPGSLKELVKTVNKSLGKIKYPQQPQIEGSEVLMNGLFF